VGEDLEFKLCFVKDSRWGKCLILKLFYAFFYGLKEKEVVAVAGADSYFLEYLAIQCMEDVSSLLAATSKSH
jgi:hypothetical protein